MQVGLIVDGEEAHIKAIKDFSPVRVFPRSLSGADGLQGCYAFACRTVSHSVPKTNSQFESTISHPQLI